MIKVMIVDDEPIVRNDVMNLINWEEHGYCIVAEASNGKDGISKYLDTQPNIIITDIKMPVMNGLDMANDILTMNEDVLFILLTAYNDFDYAREAINLNIHSYVLKHELNSQILITELNKLMSIKQNKNESSQHKMNHDMAKLVEQDTCKEDVHHILNTHHLCLSEHNLLLMMIKIDKQNSGELFSVRDLPSYKKQLLVELMREITFQSYRGMVAELQNDEFIMVLSDRSVADASVKSEDVLSLCKYLQMNAKDKLNLTISVCISDQINHHQDFNRQYTACKNTMKQRLFSRDSIILFSHMKKMNPAANDPLLDSYLKTFRDHLKNNEFNDCIDCIKKILLDIVIKAQNMDILYSVVDRIFDDLNEQMKEKGLKNHDLRKRYGLYSGISENYINVYDISAYVINTIEEIAQIHKEMYSKKIQAAIKYINSHYNQNVSLEELSHNLGISRVYLSQLFSKEVGQSFKSYMNHYRVQIAIDLLKTGHYKIYEIADMVGYKNVQYFCHVFKQISGKNPSDI